MRPPKLTPQDLRQALSEAPVQSAAGLAQRLRVSQPTLSRGLAALGSDVLRIGHARAARYAQRRVVGALGSDWPLYRLTEQGQPQFLGTLSALHGGHWHFAASRAAPAWLQGEFRAGLFPDLPWFLEDMRPQGYLGRAFAHAHARELNVPEDLHLWNSDHALAALLRYGHDALGDLVLGEAMLERALREMLEPPQIIALHERAAIYPQRARNALQGRPMGSSAAGEQPKFSALLEEAPARYRAAIVKFSEPMDSAPSARRWADLLQCEHLAAQVLQAAGVPAAPTHALDAEGRRFLQSTRFDRTPTLGRRGFVTLRSLDAAFFGQGRESWTSMADRLQRQGWLSDIDAQRMRIIGSFGELIANSDMHFGNLAFVFADQAPFDLVPVYDMSPMRYAPSASGAVVSWEYLPAVPQPLYLDAWRSAARLAQTFWSQVAEDPWISSNFQAIAKENLVRLGRAVSRWG